MDNKLELLLNKIKLDKDLYLNFKNGKIVKIISSKDKLNWNFVIKVDSLLQTTIYETFDNNLSLAFPNLKSVTYTIDVDNITNAKVNDYYPYVINSLKLGKAISMIFLSRSIKFTTNGMVLEAFNKAEENIIRNNLKNIIDKYKQIGFSNFSLSTELVNEDSKVKSEIDKELNDETKKAINDLSSKQIKKVNTDRTPLASTKEIEGSSAILGINIDGEITKIEEVTREVNDVTIEGYIFGKELFESSKSQFKIITLKISDLSDSLIVKIFFKNEDDFKRIDSKLKENEWYKFNGRVSFDTYANDLVLSARNIESIESKFVKIEDKSDEKRVELHTHTMMSQMDSVVTVEDLINQAKKWGHRGIAITDHDGVQAFPNAFNLVRGMNKDLKEGEEPFKVIYGCELVMVDDNVDIVIRATDDDILDTTYVVFDLETTGFNAGGADSIIEIGATKIKDGQIIDSFDELIDPGRKLPKKITELTNITDDTASNENKTNSSWTNYLLSQHLLEAKLTRERSKDLGDSEDFNKTITINKDDVKELLSKLEANKLSKTWSGGMGGPVRDQLTISYEHNDQKYEFVIIYGCIIVDKLDDEFKNILENNKFDEQDKEYENIQGAFYVYKLSDYTETIFDKYFE